MQIESEQILREPGAGLAGRSLTLPAVATVNQTYLLLAIVVLGVAVRFYGITNYSLAGDEYNSLSEAQHVGLNWNSIIYSILMHFWIAFGSSEIWLRLPAALFGIGTIPILFKAGARLGDWRTGAVAGLLAATSPFSIYHSQEVRFYSLFMFAAAAFLLVTIHYAQSGQRNIKSRLSLIFAGLFLLVSHFIGIIALCAQSTATFFTLKRRKLSTVLAGAVGVPLLLFGLPLLPPVRASLLRLYETFGNYGGDTKTISVSAISLAKMGFAGFTFVFGYHVYPRRLWLVIPGSLVISFLLICGVRRLVRQRTWVTLALTYALAVVGVYLVLDSVGGRVANGISPRHVAFAWPVFILLLALGLSHFRRIAFRVLLLAVVGVNAISVAYGWRKDWSYAPATDYRAAAQFVSQQSTSDAAIIFAGHTERAIDHYFSNPLPSVEWFSYLRSGDGSSIVQNKRLIFLSDDWEPNRRQQVNRVLRLLAENYDRVDGRVDYPLFEYAFDRSAASAESSSGTFRQLNQPLSIYGLEFQDLRLPISVNAKGANLQVKGAAELPTMDGEQAITIPVRGGRGNRLVLLANATFAQPPAAGTTIAEVLVDEAGVIQRFPLRLGIETAAWDQTCPSTARCETVFQWHKRMAMVGQNSYPGAWRDFQAGLHTTVFDLSQGSAVTKISIRYLAGEGHFYLWAVAFVA